MLLAAMFIEFVKPALSVNCNSHVIVLFRGIKDCPRRAHHVLWGAKGDERISFVARVTSISIIAGSTGIAKSLFSVQILGRDIQETAGNCLYQAGVARQRSKVCISLSTRTKGHSWHTLILVQMLIIAAKRR